MLNILLLKLWRKITQTSKFGVKKKEIEIILKLSISESYMMAWSSCDHPP